MFKMLDSTPKVTDKWFFEVKKDHERVAPRKTFGLNNVQINDFKNFSTKNLYRRAMDICKKTEKRN